ncbi:RNA polymerase sigma factor [Fodinicola acaciae]|uniref:RNA polymerase sigma factor n=1 Tax=Fodinicola acaciae TaxID=2681555 RepID=UPI001C9E8EA6|nr:SigE family RNA polymerase sigma factor [Fodinicola acaciae]
MSPVHTGSAAVGSEAAIAELYKGCYRRLVRSAYALTGDLEEAQDVVQEIFAKAVAAPRKVLAADDPEAWLRTSALNLARTRHRRRAWLDRFLRRSRPDPAGAPNVDRVALLAAMKQLSPVLREAVGLFYLADLSIDEISAALGAPVGTVKARLSRGRTALADILSVKEDDK